MYSTGNFIFSNISILLLVVTALNALKYKILFNNKKNNIRSCITNLHQSFQLVELAMKIFKVVFVESSEAIHVHDFYQHAEGLLLRHLKTHGKLKIAPLWIQTSIQVHMCICFNK